MARYEQSRKDELALFAPEINFPRGDKGISHWDRSRCCPGDLKVNSFRVIELAAVCLFVSVLFTSCSSCPLGLSKSSLIGDAANLTAALERVSVIYY